MFVLGLLQGRLVYSVYGISNNNSAILEMIVAVYYGGLHAITIAFAVATFILSIAMKRTYGAMVAYLGIFVGALDLLFAFPWLIGPIPSLICQTFFALWFLAIGAKMLRIHREQQNRGGSLPDILAGPEQVELRVSGDSDSS